MLLPLKTLLLLLAFLLFAAVFANQTQAGTRKRILVLCTGNSARSQMAEGILRSLDSGLEVSSAGTQPAAWVNPNAIRVMQEIGLDISQGKPKSVSQFVSQSFDYVITVCDDADQNCPVFTGRVGKRIHIGFTDPAKARGSDEYVMSVFRQVRDQIRIKFGEFYKEEIKSSL
jgi:arsenate reductase (thioredoxin)